MSTQNTSEGISFSDTVPLFERIKQFRKARGWNQSQLAEVCGVTQSQVSRWEKNFDRPSPGALGAIAMLADDKDRASWIAEAAPNIPPAAPQPTTSNVRIVPILKDSAAAGTPRAIDERNIDMHLPLPRTWLPRGGKLYGIEISGDSMAPVVGDGYIVLVDVAQRDASQLVGRMVAARDEDGVTVKWLRRDGNMYFLVPQNPAYPIRVVRGEGEWSIVGEVVKIIGDPPKSN